MPSTSVNFAAPCRYSDLTCVNAGQWQQAESLPVAMTRSTRKEAMIGIANGDLRQFVKEELEFGHSIDAADVGFVVKKGLMTLTAQVPTYEQKRPAGRVVTGVKGVRGYRPGDRGTALRQHATADDEIAERARETLQWNTAIPQDAIKVSLSKRWVALSGDVEWQHQRENAERVLRDLSGATGVSNNVVIKSSVPPEPHPACARSTTTCTSPEPRFVPRRGGSSRAPADKRTRRER